MRDRVIHVDLMRAWFFSGGNPSLPPKTPAPTSDDPATRQAAEAAAAKERLLARNRKGRQGSILTGGQGLTNSPDLSRPSLLGATGGSLGQPGTKQLLGQ